MATSAAAPAAAGSGGDAAAVATGTRGTAEDDALYKKLNLKFEREVYVDDLNSAFAPEVMKHFDRTAEGCLVCSMLWVGWLAQLVHNWVMTM